MNRGYEAKIVECSMELTAKQRVQLKDTTDCVKIDEAAKVEDVIINVTDYAVVEVHNEQAENTDYNVYILIDDKGQRYVTGSEVFFSRFTEIWDEMHDSGEEWAIRCYRQPSRNRAGQSFLTCSVI